MGLQMNYEDGIFYAVQVVRGEILVCRNVRLACQRFLNQLEDILLQFLSIFLCSCSFCVDTQASPILN